MATCLIALGANLGQRATTLNRAVELLSRERVQVIAQSRWYETAAVGGPDGQQAFLNGAIRAETSLTPNGLLDAMDRVEAKLGRQRRERWEARTLDLDLLLYGDLVIANDRLVVPHPRMALRRFVLEPAAEVAPRMVHPLIGWTVGELFDHLCRARPYIALAGMNAALRSRLASQFADTARLLLDPVDRQTPLVQQRAQLLAVATWPNDYRWTISDFWFDQPEDATDVSAAPGATGSASDPGATGLASVFPGVQDQSALAEPVAPDAQQRLHDESASLRSDLVQPKLLVHLQQHSDPLSGYIRQLHERRALGPVLTLPADDEPRAVKEIAAAMEAMR